MKKAIFILSLCVLITGCTPDNTDSVNLQTEEAALQTEAFQDDTEPEVSVTEVCTEFLTPETEATEVCTEIFTEETTAVTEMPTDVITSVIEETAAVTETTVTTNVRLSESDRAEVTDDVRSAEEENAEYTEAEFSENIEEIPTEAEITVTEVQPETTEPETDTQPAETHTEPPESSKSECEKAFDIYNYVRANCDGTCVQHSYMAYEMCRSEGIECYFIWTENGIYGHVANAVKVDGCWYIMDTQAGGFLIANDCGFTEIVDENENHIADADLISPYSH